MNFGYARVSTSEQNLDMQIEALKKYGVEKIFSEKISTRKKQPKLEEMIKQLRKGDTVVIYKLDRISRSTKHLIQLSEQFDYMGVNFVSLKDNIDTTNPMGRFFFRTMASIAELERDIISERTKDGLSEARARGRNGGRPKTNMNKIETALKMYDSKNFSIKEITKATQVSQSTLYRYVREREIGKDEK